jgi:hypothetical protein
VNGNASGVYRKGSIFNIMRTFFRRCVSHKRPTKFHHISLTAALEDGRYWLSVSRGLFSETESAVRTGKTATMTKTPKTADELKSDSDRMEICSLSNRKVSQLVDLTARS